MLDFKFQQKTMRSISFKHKDSDVLCFQVPETTFLTVSTHDMLCLVNRISIILVQFDDNVNITVSSVEMQMQASLILSKYT